MKLLIIGAAGVQVQPAIEHFLKSTEFESITLADLNLKAVNDIVEKHQDSRLSACQMDIFDHDHMVQTMKKVDIVYNSSGPYHLLGLKVLKASIEAGKHYVDYCDDTEPTLQMLELTEQAKAKNLTAIIGLGVSPGYLNLVAKDFSDKLDQTDEINMYWSIAQGEPEGPAVIDHMCDVLSGEAIQFLDGEFVKVPALSGFELEVDMPEPFGRLPTAFVGHPEPATLPRYIPGVKQVINKYATSIDEIGFYQGLAELGLMDKEPVIIKGQKIAPRDLLVNQLFLASKHAESTIKDPISAAVLEVKGKEAGELVTYRTKMRGHMAPLTSLPAAFGVQMLARGEITTRGVMAPEGFTELLTIIQPLLDTGLIEQETTRILS